LNILPGPRLASVGDLLCANLLSLDLKATIYFKNLPLFFLLEFVHYEAVYWNLINFDKKQD